MNIQSVRYTQPDENWVEITFDGDSKGTTSTTDGVRRQYTDQLDEWLGEGNTIDPYDKYYGMTLAEVKEQNQNKCDSDTSANIYASISAETQMNTANGLLEQSVAEIIKSEISTALSENTGFIADIEILTSNAQIDAYMAQIERTPMTGGR